MLRSINQVQLDDSTHIYLPKTPTGATVETLSFDDIDFMKMSFPGEFSHIPCGMRPPGHPPDCIADPRVPLSNLSTVQARMESVQRFLSDSVNRNILIGKDQMDMISAEIASAIHQIMVNGAALLGCSPSDEIPQNQKSIGNTTRSMLNPPADSKLSEPDLDSKVNAGDSVAKFTTTSATANEIDLKMETVDEEFGEDWEIIELDAAELLAEHVHFCDICGKGFKRDANLRMHMRAHGNQFKTPEALSKPEKTEETNHRVRFSCPYAGCNRSKSHKKFRPLKSAICLKNHFKRSHCPKMYSCDRCNRKSFSVVADLKSHLKHCGESKWKCCCGTSFSRKDKLFGHMALFEGHMPAVEEEEKGKEVATVAMEEDEEDEEPTAKEMESGPDNGLFEGLFDGFGSIENYCLQDLLDSPN